MRLASARHARAENSRLHPRRSRPVESPQAPAGRLGAPPPRRPASSCVRLLRRWLAPRVRLWPIARQRPARAVRIRGPQRWPRPAPRRLSESPRRRLRKYPLLRVGCPRRPCSKTCWRRHWPVRLRRQPSPWHALSRGDLVCRGRGPRLFLFHSTASDSSAAFSVASLAAAAVVFRTLAMVKSQCSRRVWLACGNCTTRWRDLHRLVFR